MRCLDRYFENRTIDVEKMREFGFIRKDNSFVYEAFMSNPQFKIVVEISKERKFSKVIDRMENDEYELVDVKETSGNFVSKMKEELEMFLNELVNKCTKMDVFKQDQTKNVIDYIKEKYEADCEHLWEKFPENAIWRNQKNKKWFGALLVISESKLGLESNKITEILDLRYQKEEIKSIIDNEKVFSGYHMNKNNWITIRLDGSVELEEIYKLIDNSYFLSLKK